MPEFSRDGKTAITICSGIEAKTITIDGQGHPAHKTIKIPCVFSVHTTPVATVQAVVFIAPVFAPIVHDMAAPQILQAGAVHPYTSRAPPIA